MQKNMVGENKKNINDMIYLLNQYLHLNPKQMEYVRQKNIFLKKLQNYLNFIDKVEETLSHRRTYVKNVSLELFQKKYEDIIYAGYKLEKEIDSIQVKEQLKKMFRVCTRRAYQSNLAKRGLEKPLGYAGDYLTIEMFYDRKLASPGIGSYFDYCCFNNPLAHADIYRKNKMVKLLKDAIRQMKKDNLNIMNLGCGGCKDIRDLFSSFQVKNKELKFLAVDQDREALQFSKTHLRNLPAKVLVEFKRANIIDLICDYRNRDVKNPFNNKDIVYSIGLVDYFANNTLGLFVRFCVKSLMPGGVLIFAHKNAKKKRSFLLADWLADWRFYKRDLSQVKKIIKDEIKGCDMQIEWERTHHMFFFIITKK
ncbi:MAG: class I SAM-dependent methyltransferase [Candidatus Omnitrophica bacterium]|nr:class I SAM-dependent methyltransferase [Candidatus Omnitrophota bacterium]